MGDQKTEQALLEEENTLLREDAETYQNRIEDLKGQIERLTREQAAYEENVVGSLNEKNIALARDKAGLEQRVTDLEALISSMRINGARHHFVFAYDRHVEEAGRRLQFCRDCDKEKDHPAHFAQGSRYLDSREVEKAAKEAQERLERVLRAGMKLTYMAAMNTARELLQGLPGIEPFQSVPGRVEVGETPGISTKARICNACPRDEDHHQGADHPFGWGNVPR